MIGNREQLRNILEELPRASPGKAPSNLVGRFREALEQAGVEILRPENSPTSKYFAAGRNERGVLVLAHESTHIKWWGVGQGLIDRIKEKPIDWGILLLWHDYRRGFWIPGDNFFKLRDLNLVTLGEARNFNFNEDNLERRPDLARAFFSVPRFLKFSGLETA